MNTSDLIVIGGGAAGMSIAAAAKRARPEWRVVVIEAGNWISYASCGIPYYIGGEVKSLDSMIVLDPKTALEKKGIEALIKHRIESIDPNAKTVTVVELDNDRRFEMKYGKLAFATGASPVIPPIPGIECDGVFTVRAIDDGERIKRFIEANEAKNAVILGAGLVGMEMAESLRNLGLSVTVIELQSTALGLSDSKMSQAIVSHGESHGVKFIFGGKVTDFESKDGKLVSVHTDDEEIPADIAIVGTGIKPNVELAHTIGLELGACGAIYVDLQGAASRPGIYAAGDCAQIRDLVTGKWVWFPLGTTANRQGRAVGYSLAGRITQFKGIVRAAIAKFFALGIVSIGVPKHEIETIGWQIAETTIKANSHSGYYPGHEPVFVHLYSDLGTGRILGGQYIGPWRSAKRFDIIAAAVAGRMTTEDLAYLDIPYAPPFGTVWDPINIAARKLMI